MKEIALNILDIANNSISANCTLLSIDIIESVKKNFLKINITDNGCGMNEETLKKVADPFFSSKKIHHIGLGVPLFKQHAEMTGGSFSIKSQPNVGTTVSATFVYDHPDRQPLGNVEDTVAMLISSHPEIDYYYHHITDYNESEMDTRKVKEVLGDIPINTPEVIKMLIEMMSLE